MDLPIHNRRQASFSLIQLNHLYQEQAFTDFTIEIYTQEKLVKTLQVHKIILASASGYFKNLFRSNMQEAQQNCIILNETYPEIFAQIIASLYGQQCSIQNFNEMIYVLKTLKYYQFYNPMDRINRYIEDMQVPAEGFNKYIEMITYVYDGLTPDIVNTIAKKITPESQLQELSDELLHYIFSSKYFPRSTFQNELQVFNLIHQLVLNDHDITLYKHVQFINLSSEERWQLVEKDKISSDKLLECMEQSTRFALTYNLLEKLQRECYHDEQGIISEDALLVKVQAPSITRLSKIGAHVVGDGDQTPVKTMFSRHGNIKEGDLVKITNYAVVMHRNAEDQAQLNICAIKWKKL